MSLKREIFLFNYPKLWSFLNSKKQEKNDIYNKIYSTQKALKLMEKTQLIYLLLLALGCDMSTQTYAYNYKSGRYVYLF